MCLGDNRMVCELHKANKKKIEATKDSDNKNESLNENELNTRHKEKRNSATGILVPR